LTSNPQDLILEYQKKYEADPSSIDNAYLYFRVRIILKSIIGTQ